ncbi:MAG: hypothetical protein L6R41_003974 [Letrouitia leprolyta]|nr:MAG: hypothetical protein L6R41_003974 [Letrouitia leprolyta]
MDTNFPNDADSKDKSDLPPGLSDESRRRIWTPVNKDWVIFEKYGRETNGEYTLLTVSVAPGGGNAAHWHGSYSETFTAEKGDVGIYMRSRGKFLLAPGESATVKPGEVHCFSNSGDEDVEMEVKLQPANEGFEKSLYILYGLARDGKCAQGGIPKSFMHLAVIATMSDMWPAGWRGAVLIPVLRIFAWWGRKQGIEEQLIKQYWI